MRVAAFGCGKNYTSARFRVRQFIPDLAEHGIKVHEYIAPIYKHLEPENQNPLWLAAIRYARPTALVPSIAASHAYQASWIQKEMIWGRDTMERFTKRPRFFDVDDALWVPREGSAEHIARLAGRMDVIMAGNEVIAEWFSHHATGRAHRPHRHRLRPVHTAEPGSVPDHPFTIVWTGQKVTLYHLATIEEALRIFMERHPEVRFHAISDVGPEMTSLPADRVTFIPWSRDVEVRGLQEADIGVMPLVDDENGRAKCGFKMLQYMGCALPSVVTPIGLNADILANPGRRHRRLDDRRVGRRLRVPLRQPRRSDADGRGGPAGGRRAVRPSGHRQADRRPLPRGRRRGLTTSATFGSLRWQRVHRLGGIRFWAGIVPASGTVPPRCADGTDRRSPDVRRAAPTGRAAGAGPGARSSGRTPSPPAAGRRRRSPRTTAAAGSAPSRPRGRRPAAPPATGRTSSCHRPGDVPSDAPGPGSPSSVPTPRRRRGGPRSACRRGTDRASSAGRGGLAPACR